MSPIPRNIDSDRMKAFSDFIYCSSFFYFFVLGEIIRNLPIVEQTNKHDAFCLN